MSASFGPGFFHKARLSQHVGVKTAHSPKNTAAPKLETSEQKVEQSPDQVDDMVVQPDTHEPELSPRD